MLTKSILLRHYKRKDIQEAIVEHAKDKEIGIRYDYGFGKRPDIISYPRDVLELAMRGMTSLHASEETWFNPLNLSSELSKKELTELRSGWDLVLDIDCALFEYSRICAHLIIEFLKYNGVEDISIKFSGNKGFHIGVPFEAFPSLVGDTPIRELFPLAAQKIALYVKENIKEELGKRILAFEQGSFSSIKEKVGLESADITRYDIGEFGDKIPKLNVDKFLEIDTVLLSSRHLYRMPYSLHEKSGLASVPLDPGKVMEFEKSMAKPDELKVSLFKFLDRNASGESARKLLLSSLDFEVKLEEEREEKQYEEIEITSAISPNLFPPCMKHLMNGIEDGKKRAVFAMMNFLGKIGWSKKEVEAYLMKWNKANPQPLREVYIKGQLNHFKPGARLPPNCSNEAYYLGIGVCKPDGLCKKIKNPTNYSILRWKRSLRDKENDKSKETKEKQKE